ncbi:glycoside hydrolase family 38 C-terminal domain-containing protein [Dysgonomonas sp. 511]|uniref:glycoside hydrolase family 38 N-terminal domain-containing protein n=1 Tax=Dysgonomonas sp. 511 TaxID=2302930 RepID=UPI0013D1EC41|nr:glycoside hydrolase family 38 C-terminal domain-containing protein [Dysgonomonas sp. 511]NDV78668.1 T9SS C-terminal target domain-containing protein [Dysgonomonas sp. 511]
MKKDKLSLFFGVIPLRWAKGILVFLLIAACQPGIAQTYIPLELAGYNTDAIVHAGEDPSQSGFLDKPSNGYTYYSKEWRNDGGLSRSFTSNGGVAYQLAAFTSNNVLKLSPDGSLTGSLTLVTPIKTGGIWVLGTATEANSKVKIKVHYDDGTSHDAGEEEYRDWYSGNSSGTAIHGLKRIRTNSSYDDRANFSLYEKLIPTDNTKNIVSVEFQIDNNKYLSIFAISAYDINSPIPQAGTVYMIPNSHLDTQWNWTVETSIDQYVKNTLEKNFELFEKYPGYKFNFEGAIKYKFAKEYYPELYDKLKGYIASGQWNISGGSVDANDVMVPSAESIIRNFLYGQEYYKKEFGIKGGSDIMLPDCFGFPYSLPTLASHCGVTGFHSAKLGWGSAYDLKSLPNFGVWRGVDGSEIFAVYKPGAYDTESKYRKNIAYDSDILSEINSNKSNYGVASSFRYIGNVGDRGGAVADETAGWLTQSAANDGPVKVKLATPTEFFNSITPAEKSSLHVWDNELPMETHGVGCYTSQTILKYWNRRNELLADATEKSSVLAHWLGGLPYQSEPIRNSWTNVLWHQFHDDLPGTSIPQAYNFTYNDHILAQKNLSGIFSNAIGAVARQMDTQVTGIPIVVSNPLSVEREDVVEVSIPLETEPSFISVYAPDGSVVAAQKNGYKDGQLSLIFLAKMPSLGYATYDLRLEDNASASVSTNLAITTNTIENDEYKVTVDANGDVSSILDKKQGGKELLKSPIRQSMSLDKPGYWLAWEISRGDIERAPYGYVGENATVSIAENGPLRASLKITRSASKDRDNDVPSTFTPSEFVQYIQMTSHGSKDRIDFVNEIDWKTTETFLKAEFDLNATNEKATFDLSIGTIERKTRKPGDKLYEVVGHQWADVTHNDDSYGVSILNDSKYGWDKATDNKLRLTLIHTPKKDGNDYAYHKNQDLGLNKFTYSFFRHMGKWDETTQWEAAKLNQPLTAHQAPKHTGALGKSYGFVSLNTDKVAVKALKKAESGDNMIVRVYELTGESHSNVEIQFPANIVSASEVNGIEENVGAVSFSGNKLTFDITKYQPKTFSVQLATATTTIDAPASTKVALAYDMDVMSSDAAKTDGQFGDAPYLYPAELLADEIEADGIKFSIGGRTDGSNNAMSCNGQEIDIPQNAANRKIYILAASKNPKGSKVSFGVDGIGKEMKVDYYAGFAGQWGSAYATQEYVSSNVAFAATHRHNIKDNKNNAYHFMYIYKYAIEIDANAQKLILPKNDDVMIFAVTVSDNANDDAIPVSTIAALPKFETIESLESNPVGEALSPDSFDASGQTNNNEGPRFAADNNPWSKWCDNSSPNKWLQYNFDDAVEISQWSVLHAGLENEGNITSEFRLQRYDAATESWIDVDVVTNNTQAALGNFDANKTFRAVTPFTTTKVRLAIDRGEVQHNVARIHEFTVYGKLVVDDNDATLASLTVSQGTLSPAFDPQTEEYTVTVGETITSLEINGTTTNTKASVEGTGTKDNLATGDNVFNVVVTAKDGFTTKTYKVKVVRTASADASLKSLEVSVGTLTPSFSPLTYDYTVNVENDVTAITLTAEVKHDNATLTGDGLKENLQLGNNKFEIVVTAQDGATQQTYTVNVVRRVLNSDASLHRILVNGEEWNLDNRYDMGCDDILSLMIEPTDPTATVDIGKTYSETITTATLKTIAFRITAEDGSYQDYALNIERRYAFDDIISVKWNNTLMINLKKVREDGFTPTGYQWYKNGSAMKGATAATYSAGASKVDLLESESEYHLEMSTTIGRIRTCARKPDLKSLSVKVFPNPAAYGEAVYLDADIEDEMLEGASIETFNLNGVRVSSAKVTGRVTEIRLPASSGTYIVKFAGKGGFVKDLKVIVK